RVAGVRRWRADHWLRLGWRVPHLGDGRVDRVIDLDVLTVAADVAGQRLGDLGARWAGIGVQQGVGAHDEAARAAAALQAAPHPERTLDGMQTVDTWSGRQAGDRLDLLAAAESSGVHGATVDGLPVDDDGARAALGAIAAEVDAVDAQ